VEHLRFALEQYVAAVRSGMEHEADSDGEHAYEVAYYRLHLAQAELLVQVLEDGGVHDERVDAWLKLEKRAHASSYLPDAEGERCEVAFLNLAQAITVARDQRSFSAQ
jgi:hypothetical protein